MPELRAILLKMAPKLPNLKTVAFCIMLLTCYHIIMVYIHNLLHVQVSPTHALLTSERLDFISTHLREMYRLKDMIERDPRQTKSATLQALLDNLRTLEEVISPWDLAEMKREKKLDQTFLWSPKALEVCPESYMGSVYAEPLYEKAFVTEECDNAPRLGSLLTILLNFHQQENEFRIYGVNIISSVTKIHPGMPIIVALPQGSSVYNFGMKVQSTVSFLQVAPSRQDGDVWNDLINNANTKYVLVGRNLTYFDRDSNLERIIREMGNLAVPFMGGATKSSEGHWSLSCYQSHLRNYKFSYKLGYHRSDHGCMYCDYISGPFIAKTRALRSRTMDRKLVRETAFDDLFLRLKRAKIRTAVCPDAMFHVTSNSPPPNQGTWLLFAQKWGTVKLFFNNFTRPIEFTCPDLGISCKADRFSVGKTVPPCCQKGLIRAVQRVMKQCDAMGIECELQSMALLGAVQTGHSLPWQRTATITFLSSNHTAIGKLSPRINRDGLSLTKERDVTCCTLGQTDGGEFKVNTDQQGYGPGLTIKLVGQYRMTFDDDQERAGSKQTWVSLDGAWVRAPRNPGLYLRNRYGVEMMKHSEGRALERAPLSVTSGFQPCPKASSQDCLDQYELDGALQFDQD